MFIIIFYLFLLKKVTISILTDNVPGDKASAEHGWSCLIEHDDRNFLFDTGQSNLFLKNAEIMGIDLSGIDFIVLSHGHFDHGDGLQYLPSGRLICHPGVFIKRYRRPDFSFIGLKNSKDELTSRFSLETSSDPFWITNRILFLGEIPRLTDFESGTTSFVLDEGIPDFVIDDSAVALILNEGLFVITGCGHSGIVNTLEYARKVTGEKRIFGIMGGFHLKAINRQAKETVNYLKKSGVRHVYPAHCTDDPVRELFSRTFMTKKVRAGEVFTFQE